MNETIRLVIWILFVTFAVSRADAQDMEFSVTAAVKQWSEETGVIIMPAAERLALDAVAAQFSEQAIAAGVSPTEAARFSRSISEGAMIAGTSEGIKGKWLMGEVELSFDNPSQVAAVQGALGANFIYMQLRQLPRIIVQVEPVPPRDYAITINGQKAHLRDEGKDMFAVGPGPASVRVTRQDQPACTWSGVLSHGDEQNVTCQM